MMQRYGNNLKACTAGMATYNISGKKRGKTADNADMLKTAYFMATNRQLWQRYGNRMATLKNYIYQCFIVLCCHCCHKYIKRVLEDRIDRIARHSITENRRIIKKTIYRELWQQWQQWQQIESATRHHRDDTRRAWTDRGA